MSLASPVMLRAAVALTVAALVWSGIAPYDRTTWWLEVMPVLIALPVLYLTRRRYPLTPLLYVLLFLHGLVLIGGGDIAIPESVKDDVYDLGFVSKQDKYNAMAAASLLCQPSHNESFSLVIMESWLCGRPVLVSSQCAVTKDFAKRSNGGLYFKDYFEFEGCVEYILEHPEAAAELGANGGAFVRENFEWDIIVEKYRTFFQKLMGA